MAKAKKKKKTALKVRDLVPKKQVKGGLTRTADPNSGGEIIRTSLR